MPRLRPILRLVSVLLWIIKGTLLVIATIGINRSVRSNGSLWATKI